MHLNESKERVRLQHLNLCSNYIDMEFESPILRMVHEKGLLRELDLVGSPSLNIGGLLNLDSIFEDCEYPQGDSLSLLFQDGVIREETQIITRFIKNNEKLTQLILYEYMMDEGVASSFHYDIFSNADITSKLQNLSLFFTKMSDESMELLTDFMKMEASAFAKLKILDLRGNNITNQGAIALADALDHCYKQENGMRLRHLNLASNPIKVQGFAKLLQALAIGKHTEGVQILNLSDLDVDKILPEKLAESVVEMTMLRKVDLGFNGIKAGSGAFFKKIIENHGSLRKLDLGGNELTAPDLAKI